MLDFLDGRFSNTFGGKSNLGRCSDIVAAISPEITSCDVGLQKILSIRVLSCQRT